MSAIFLDRDGVIIRKAPEGSYVTAWNEVQFLPGALEAIAAFSRHGRKVIIITNQRGIANGQIQQARLDDIHTKMKMAIEDRGGHIAAIYYCPHEKVKECDCRKPRPGMLLRAAQEHKLRLRDCWMIGDAASDILAGQRAGCKTAFITQFENCSRWTHKPDLCAESLAMAAEQILFHSRL